MDGVWDKLREEEGELREAAADGDPTAVEHEVGDVLFAWANLARKLGVHPDVALRKANARFRGRFHHVESVFDNDADSMRTAGLDALEDAWQQAKRLERERNAG